MKAADYNRLEYEAGRLSQKQISYLGDFPEIIAEYDALLWNNIALAVIDFQDKHKESHGLTVDGKAGEATRAVIDDEMGICEKIWPMYGYKGRVPIITSPYGRRDKGFHFGSDIAIPWLDSDPDDKIYGEKFRSGKSKGKRFCWTPPECRMILCVAAGVVTLCGKRTNGYRFWIDHREFGLDLCTGYLHLDEDTARVNQGSEVLMGQHLAAIWGDRKIIDPPHLHYEELNSIGPYAPRKPNMSKTMVVFAE